MKLKVKEFEVKDGRVIAKFLVKTGLKKTLFDVMFPKDNPNMPKNWLELRKHVQTVHNMSDEEFKNLQKEVNGDFKVAVNRYIADFPAEVNDMGELLIDTILELFSDDSKYEAMVDLFAHIFQCDKAIIEALSIQEAVEAIKLIMKDTGFFELLQPSTETKTDTANDQL